MNDIRLTGTVELAAAADANAPKRFTMVAYTGASMKPGGYGSLVIDAAGVRIPTPNYPVLRGHDDTKIVGHAEKTEVRKDGSILVEGVISAANEHAREVVESAKNGFRWQASVGMSVEKSEFVEAGAVAQANGKPIKGPLTVIRGATLREVSFVPIGADGATSAAIAARETMMNEFDTWLAANGYDMAAMTDQQRTAIRPAYDSQQQRATAATRSNVSAIRELTAKFVKECPRHEDMIHELAAEAIGDQWDADKFEAKATMTLMRLAGPGGNSIQRDRRSGATSADVLTCSMLGTLGVSASALAKHFPERVVDQSVSAPHRNLTLQGLLRKTLQAAGEFVPSGRLTDGDIRTAFSASRRLEASGGASTISLPGVLGAVANKMALMSFASASATWSKFARKTSHGNFHTATKYRMTMEGTFQEVAGGGELKHVTLTEDSRTNQLKTFGALIGISRKDLINDDLNTLATVPKLLGRMGAVAVEKATYTALLGNANNFFHTDNANVETGAGSALAAAGLNAALARFRTQTDSNSDPLLIEPRILLVPPALESTAKALMQSTTVVASTTADSTLPAGNPFVGLCEVVVGSYLATAFGLTNASNAAWYLLCEPGDNSVVEVAFLNGQETPTVQTAELDFDQLGVQMRSFYDFGVALGEPRGGVRSAGS